MAKKTKSGRHQIDLAEELKDILEQYGQELFEVKEQALDKASDYLLNKLKAKSPRRTGNFSKSWIRTDKYKGVRYIGNTAVGSKNEYGYEIPLANLIEFSSKGKPFIRQTFEENKEQIINIIKGEIENANSK